MCSVDSTVGSSIEYFSLITFSDVSESYSSFSDITSHFTRALNMSPDSSDYVGIFPVGWKSVDEYVCSQPVVVPADLSSSSVCTHSVTFPAASLPRDSEEFYQFCYVSASDGRVRGVSTPFQFVGDRQNDWELLEPPLCDVAVHTECESEQQQQWQQPDVVDESSQVSLSVTADGSQTEVETLKHKLHDNEQELEKQASDYGSSMNAMQLSLDEIRRQCVDKEAKLEQLRATLAQYEKREEKHNSELDALKSVHASALANQASDCQVHKLQLDVDRSNIAQLQKDLDVYQRKEEDWKQRETALLSELQRLREETGAVTSVSENVEHATNEHSAAAVAPSAGEAEEQQTDVTATDHVEDAADEQEQFEDASSIPVDRLCPICNETFSASEPVELFISHVEDHVVKVCPICSMEFKPEDSIDYVNHVDVCIITDEQQQLIQQEHEQQHEQQQEQQQPPSPSLHPEFQIV